MWVWVKSTPVSPCFHLPGFHFGTRFWTHVHVQILLPQTKPAARTKTSAQLWPMHLSWFPPPQLIQTLIWVLPKIAPKTVLFPFRFPFETHEQGSTTWRNAPVEERAELHWSTRWCSKIYVLLGHGQKGTHGTFSGGFVAKGG